MADGATAAWLSTLPLRSSALPARLERRGLGVSFGRITTRDKEHRERAELRRVTMQALAHALEAKGLVFFPGHPPLRAGNCRGATPHPRTRDDHHLIE